jgi:transcriptional regulator with XRE-family HTH domain
MPDSEYPIDLIGHRLKAVRTQAGISLRELARQANVSPSFVSLIENGKSLPSVATLYIFAQVLNVTVDEFFDTGDTVESATGEFALEEGWGPRGDKNPSNAWHPSEYSNRVSVVHPSHRPVMTMADGVLWQRLSATPERSINFMKITYAPGATSTAGGDLVSHDSYEYGYVLEGRIEITIGSEVFVLNEGESLGFDSSIPHVLRNTGEREFQGIWLVHGHRH